MSEKDDGGAAFACAADGKHQGGMNLRDYFAAKALQGLLADPSVTVAHNNLDEFMRDTTFTCYEYADAMLEARK